MTLIEQLKHEQTKLAVVGLGYVGLPLAVEFGKKIRTIGFDLKQDRVKALLKNTDATGSVTSEDLRSASLIEYTHEAKKLKEAKFIIVAVPTPIHKNKQPDLSALTNASRLVGENLTPGSIVVFESTVYPGVTEDICVPLLEKHSGLAYPDDFKVGYSPERINPGDKEHTLTNILKIVSGCDESTLNQVASVYDMVIKAGLFRAKSIKSAEAAKVIENIQRDLNIALINELAIIFNKMGIDTNAVLEAAGTKWNFIKMQPGLVGGHCIGVDPYYLTHKAEEIGYHPQVILAGRRINDSMGKYIAEQTVKKLIEAGKTVKGAHVLILGITFKENVGDIRNSKVPDIIHELTPYGIDVSVFDPLADPEEVQQEYGIELAPYHINIKTDAIIIAVNHNKFKEVLSFENLTRHLNNDNGKGVIIDVKSALKPGHLRDADIVYWRL